MKIDLKYLKKNFNLDKFIKSLDLNYKFMNEGDMFDRIIEGGYPHILDKDGEEVMIWDILDDNLHDKLRELAKNYKLLPKLTNNFQFIREISCETVSRHIYLTCLFSKKNKTYYFFIDEYKDYWSGNCLYFKSKKKDKLMEVMGKTRNMIMSNENKDYSFRKI
tara:strand:- start:35 stop:523 length:489 start_codon:yes stop_codon:yes gene_type:complete